MAKKMVQNLKKKKTLIEYNIFYVRLQRTKHKKFASQIPRNIQEYPIYRSVMMNFINLEKNRICSFIQMYLYTLCFVCVCMFIDIMFTRCNNGVSFPSSTFSRFFCLWWYIENARKNICVHSVQNA